MRKMGKGSSAITSFDLVPAGYIQDLATDLRTRHLDLLDLVRYGWPSVV